MPDLKATTEMDATEIATFFEEKATGVLSLARDGDAYAVPETFGYDGDRLYFKFGYHDGSKKIQYLGQTDRAAFVVYETDDGSFRSVVATGPVRKVSDERVEHALSVLRENGTDPDIADFVLSEEEFEFVVYALEVETVSGRQRNDGV